MGEYSCGCVDDKQLLNIAILAVPQGFTRVSTEIVRISG